MHVDPAKIQDHRSAFSRRSSPAKNNKSSNQHEHNLAGPAASSYASVTLRTLKTCGYNIYTDTKAARTVFRVCAACLILMRGLGNAARRAWSLDKETVTTPGIYRPPFIRPLYFLSPQCAIIYVVYEHDVLLHDYSSWNFTWSLLLRIGDSTLFLFSRMTIE